MHPSFLAHYSTPLHSTPPPGPDSYKNLPSKTLQLLRYALSSQCAYTHVAKIDDDVHLRPQVRWAGRC